MASLSLCSSRAAMAHACPQRRCAAAVLVAPRRSLCAAPCSNSSSRQERRMSVRASAGDPTVPQGQVSSTLMDSMTTNIKEALEAKKVQVTDVYGDGRHVSIEVVSGLFEGKNQMQRQRMVYKAIWLELQEAVHAVDSMVTATPAEAGL